MSYNMEITNINELNIPKELFKELHEKLNDYRPNEETTDVFPSSFNDDVSECIMLFFEKHKLSGIIKFYTEDCSFDLEYNNGILKEEEE